MKRKVVLIVIIVIVALAITMIYQTFAISTLVSSDNDTHNITLTGTSQITVPAGTSKTVIYQIANTNPGVVQYGVIYKGENITVKVYNNSEDAATGTIDYGENKFVKLFIENNTTTNSTITIETVLGYENGGDLILPSGYSLVTLKHYDTAVEYINALYLENKNKIVTNGDSLFGMTEYQYAEPVNLMNDRLGGTTADYDAGNIRYYGANPNNYVDIGDRTSDNKVILYRIIGLFKDIELADGTKKDLIKVIRDESIGAYSWDNKTNGIGSSVSNNGSNNWSDSRLMMLLNPGYDSYSESNPLIDAEGDIIYGYKGSLWWDSKSGTCYSGKDNATILCDFTSTGLSFDAKNKIETVVWNLGIHIPDIVSSTSKYLTETYTDERGKDVYSGRPTEWTGKVALMYSSDYGYATDFNSCNEPLDDYDSSDNSYACRTNDWLFNNDYQWQLTPGYWYAEAGYVYSSGRVNNVVIFDDTYAVFGVRPVFYLNSELGIESGEGTSGSPYVLG